MPFHELDHATNEDVGNHLCALAQHVNELIREFDAMGRFREQVLRCFHDHSRQLDVIADWKDEREAHQYKIRADCHSTGYCRTQYAEPPAPGWEFQQFRVYVAFAKACRLADREEIEIPYDVNETCGGWFPPHLLPEDKPEYQGPLPLPQRRLTLAEQYTVLAAIHDGTLKGVEPIDPWLVMTRPPWPAEAVSAHVTVHGPAGVSEGIG